MGKAKSPYLLKREAAENSTQRILREVWVGGRRDQQWARGTLMSETQRLQRQVLQGWAVNPAGEDNAAWTRAGRVHSVDS
jgi:hypothetical protein